MGHWAWGIGHWAWGMGHWVDIDATTFNLDVEQIAAAITPKTKAIIPVHLFGQPVDMTSLMAIALAHNLSVIEDCAQSTGAIRGEEKVGSIGHIGWIHRKRSG
ncbi:hypothetical protein VF06_37840, partial [Nostoc linckia z4]|uniref:DegT/DnrJ/EryC1/StrS family aminotransferase n=1 Tax=Nostoc linckia TaxID=92942 RepID=UPI000C02333E